MDVVIEELKQRTVAIAAKVGTYQESLGSFRQNEVFPNNHRQFFRKLNQEEERYDDDQPDAEESKKFWEDICSESVNHSRDVKWLKYLQSEVSVT